MSQTETIIGIAGASGSGKSLLANQLLDGLHKHHSRADVSILNEDSYYRDRSDLTLDQRNLINFDHPGALEHGLLIEHLSQLRSGNAIDVPQYDYSQHNRRSESLPVQPSKILILEGILLLHDQQLRKLIDLAIFIDVPLDICLSRRLRRDIQQRGRSLDSVLSQYESTVRPMYFQFIEPTKKHADLIVPRGGENQTALNVLHNHLRSILI